MKLDNLLFHCSHPKRVRTKDGRSMLVSCGKCKQCLVDRQRSKTSVINQHALNYKFCFFVTLTYNNENVPLAEPVYLFSDQSEMVELYDVKTGEFFNAFFQSHKSVHRLVQLQNKSCEYKDNEYVMYARYSDCQKFIKRLRKNISKYTHEKVSYFAVSEYGAKSYRPHFHLLFFFNGQELSQVFRQLVSQSWKLGYNYTTLSEGKCASYVASYVNSLINVPNIFKLRSSKARSSHSRFFGVPTTESEFKEIWKNEPTRFVRYFYHTDKDGKKSYISPWRSFNARFFPKCQGYFMLSYSERVSIYGLYSTLTRCLPRLEGESLVHYAHYLYDYSKTHDNINTYKIKRLWSDSSSLEPLKSVCPNFDIFLGRFYQIHHYHNMMQYFGVDAWKYTSIIDQYYSCLDYTNLKESMELRENIYLEYSDYECGYINNVFVYGLQYDTTDFTDQVDDYYMYNGFAHSGNLFNDIWVSSRIYQSMVTSRNLAYQSSIKHKVQNDLANIFINS